MSTPVTFAELVDLAELGMVQTAIGPAAVMRPLSERSRARVAVMREGALDYRHIPSRMGDVLVPHGTKAVA
jgi:hypothetical protein